MKRQVQLSPLARVESLVHLGRYLEVDRRSVDFGRLRKTQLRLVHRLDVVESVHETRAQRDSRARFSYGDVRDNMAIKL